MLVYACILCILYRMVCTVIPVFTRAYQFMPRGVPGLRVPELPGQSLSNGSIEADDQRGNRVMICR